MSTTEPTTLYINGQWKPASDGGTRTVICPADGTEVDVVSEATTADVEEAIAAARACFDSGVWSSVPAAERGDFLLRVADAITERKDEFARAEALDTGKRLVEAEGDMDDIIGCYRYFGKIADANPGRLVDTGDASVIDRVVYEPVGVVGMITPWNFPLLQAAWKMAPALAAGNSFIIKPAELTPHTTMLIIDVYDKLGLPAGVANLVLGSGAVAGAPLSSHPDIDMVSFTGGLKTGTTIAQEAAKTVKKVALELGGKNPNVVFADADFDSAVDNALTAAFLDSGLVCSAGTRLIVEESIHDRFVDELVARAEKIVMGGPFDENAETGPLISAEHREKVTDYVKRGVEAGATLRVGGHWGGAEHEHGFFYAPTILDNCTQENPAVIEEGFGPVITVETFTTEEEAVAIANHTEYGLAGAVWTQNMGTANRVSRALRHGTIWINDYHPYVPQSEWGGFKRSGIGRELGQMGLGEYVEAKHIYHNTEPAPADWFPRH
ncbi:MULTISPECIES: aldehyde dehydrogenase family protein [Auritidibacter]|uniref:Aldehyde dehydrogenase family protein n=1 Tax=Auritidibacter ignavus TaxID=678932 RepID=A0AAJ6AJL1_9MICC|nr:MULTISPECIES: aldehyde dehydrogenase family protein [Auritidibacter]AXR73087.1 aldehyde dehydrogenase family protein [Auritidibacter sp. NML130574]NIH71520.1 betaine-aldehyde dehydrogenase [Auritidibacter ignavus]PXA81841.1 betaine-aldehyde dehydrogenase [Auritidibacter sp. NML120636]RMX22514.1 aldehyde dehydrogenase family protein [Auritidibacter ignavus]WGH81627.1 aldehyde dehydrogenase family protein [Auritidibacter ignavus]